MTTQLPMSDYTISMRISAAIGFGDPSFRPSVDIETGELTQWGASCEHDDRTPFTRDVIRYARLVGLAPDRSGEAATLPPPPELEHCGASRCVVCPDRMTDDALEAAHANWPVAGYKNLAGTANLLKDCRR